MIITFFGHANFVANELYKKRVLNIINKIAKNNYVEFYLGGYGAFDSFAFTCSKEYKNTNGNSSLSFVSPYFTINYQKNHLDYQKKNMIILSIQTLKTSHINLQYIIEIDIWLKIQTLLSYI